VQKNTLNDLILAKIDASGGKIPYSIYMELALYAPGLGYYANGLQKFGPTGDFTTAPEISPLFGKSISHAIQDFHLLEFGAGTGILAKTLLENHKNIKKYWILEISSELQHRQKELLKDYLDKVTWLTELPQEPFSGVILANEVIDAFPVTKFLWKDNKTYEYFVTQNNNQLSLIIDEASNSRINQFVETLDLPNNYSSEIHLTLKPWIKSLSECLKSGLILIIDYGFPRHEFYHPERSEGTIMCHYQHRAHADPLYKPGEQDITAHVDFTAIAEAAVENNLEIAGYTSQAGFLLDNNLLDFSQGAEDAAAIKLLTLPTEMGELFKVIALTKNWEKPLTGFRMQDRRHRL
jgi:SAM-dependent MidA family methyltransferase